MAQPVFQYGSPVHMAPMPPPFGQGRQPQMPAHETAVEVHHDPKEAVQLEMAPIEVQLDSSDSNSESRRIMWGGILVIFSLSTFVESMIKFLQSNPTVLADGGDLRESELSFPPIVRLISTIFGVTLSITGMFVGLKAFVYNVQRPAFSLLAFLFMAVLAAYVFVIEVFALPIFDEAKSTGPPVYPADTLNRNDVNAAFTFGTIFCLWSYCSTSLGMILAACWQLRQAQIGQAETLAGSKLKMRYMSLCVFMFGLGSLVLGSIIDAHESRQRLQDRKYIFQPNFVEFPSITVMTGVFVIIYSIPGLVGTLSMCKIQAFLAPLIFLWLITCQILVQLSHFPSTFAFAGGLLGIMSFVNVLAPTIFGSRVIRLSENY